jgi:type II restriction enzyme
VRFEFDEERAEYTSQPQRARAWSESWVSAHMYCPACGAASLSKHENNRPASDFYCPACAEEFELKAKNGRFGSRVVDGAYATLLARMSADDNPNLVLLGYNRDRLMVERLIVVPRYFFTPIVVEPRPPLRPPARRAGWVGCNILLAGIPERGRIDVVVDGAAVPRDSVLASWRRTAFLREEKMPTRGWLIEVLKCVEQIGRSEFSLSDVYAFEGRLQQAFPENNNVRPKIRQQLQRLRDNGVLEFRGDGEYRLVRK